MSCLYVNKKHDNDVNLVSGEITETDVQDWIDDFELDYEPSYIKPIMARANVLQKLANASDVALEKNEYISMAYSSIEKPQINAKLLEAFKTF